MLKFNIFSIKNSKVFLIVKCPKLTFKWTVIGSAYKKLDCKRIISVKGSISKIVFSRKITKIASAQNHAQNDLECHKAKGTRYIWNYSLRVPNFTPFCSTIVCFPDHWGFSLSHRAQWWNWNVRKQIVNKRSKDLGALLDSCSWDDIGNFLQTCIKNSLLPTKSIEIGVNSHTLPHYACINLRSYSTP